MKKLTNDKVELQKSIAYRKIVYACTCWDKKPLETYFYSGLGLLKIVTIVCIPPFCWRDGGWGLSLRPKFQKKGGGLTGSQFLEEVGGKEKGDFFQGAGGRAVGCSFFIKNKLKSQVFNDRKVYKQKCFSLSLLRT